MEAIKSNYYLECLPLTTSSKKFNKQIKVKAGFDVDLDKNIKKFVFFFHRTLFSKSANETIKRLKK